MRLLQKDIVGLDVAVHEPLAVGGREPLRDFAADAEHLGERERALRLSGLFQRAADEQLHHDVGQAVFVADLVDRHHMGVIDRRRRPALAQESARRGRVAGFRRMQHLDGDVAAELLVAGQVDAAHAALADQTHDGVAADRRRKGIVDCCDDGSHHRRLGAAHHVGGVGECGGGGVGVMGQTTDHERAERIAAVHARRLVDLDFLVVVRGDATHEPAGQRAELPLGAIDEMQLVQRGPYRLEHRRQGTGICCADHRVDDRFGVFDEIERLPPWVDVTARHLQEMWGEKPAKLLERVGQRAAGRFGQRLEEFDGRGVGIDARREIAGGTRRHARTRAVRHGLRELLDVEKDQAVHGCKSQRIEAKAPPGHIRSLYSMRP